MRRVGYGVTAKVLKRLIREVLLARAPEKLEIVASMDTQRLSDGQMEAIRETLADELVENGMGPDDQPNERGRLLEAAIDWLGRQ